MPGAMKHLLAVLVAVASSSHVTAQIAVSSNDNKAVLIDGVNTVPPNPRPDTATIIDLGATPPRVIAELDVPGGWSAPPQSVAVTPDEALALVSSSARLDPADPARTVFNDVLTVIDLKRSPPAVLATLQTGRRASGVSINRSGTLALAANRGEGTVSVYTIRGTTVTPAGKVDLGDAAAEPSLPVFSPDGRRAFVTLNNGHRIAMLSIDGDRVSYTKQDIAAGLRPYGLEITPSGDVGVVANIGSGPTGGADTLGVIDLRANPPRLVSGIFVGLIPEGIAMSPDGAFVAAAVMNGSNLPRSSPFFNDYALLKVFRLAGTTLTPVAEARIGHWCQGLAWSRGGRTLVVQCAVEKALQVFTFDGTRLTPQGTIPVGGAPTGIRTAQAPAAAQPLTLSGVLRSGEPGEIPYQVIAPAAWNGALVLDLDFTTSWNPTLRQWFLDHGYAIGGTRRLQNSHAYQIRDYVGNFLTLRALLTERMGKAPARTIAYGVSRGAIPARAAIEMHPDVFDGAVVFSGGGQALVGLLNTKLDSAWTLETLVAPESQVRLVNLAPPGTAGADSGFDGLIATAKSTPQGRARLALAAAFDQAPTWSVVGSMQPAPRDFDAQMRQVVQSFGGFDGPRSQIEAVAGGNPSWNDGVDYRRLLERSSLRDLVADQYRKAGLNLDADLDRLARAPRVTADPAAVSVAERHVGYTGRVKGPVLSVKTIGDPADPPANDTAYSETLRRAGTRDLLRNVYINRPGHATMSIVERIAAFQALMTRLESGRWADQRQLPDILNALAAQLDRESPLELGSAAFVAFTPPQALRTWDFSNWGTYRSR
jgi:DNA-binding beta-propeller fold protein YncE